jgi:hypothetical protein
LASTGRRLDSRRGGRGSCHGRSCWQGNRRGRSGATASSGQASPYAGFVVS